MAYGFLFYLTPTICAHILLFYVTPNPPSQQFTTALVQVYGILTMSFLLKALRRSIKGEKDKPQVSIAPKSAVAIVPPKKVRLLTPYPVPSVTSPNLACPMLGHPSALRLRSTIRPGAQLLSRRFLPCHWKGK